MNFFKRIFWNKQNKIWRLDYFLIFLLLTISLLIFNYFILSSTSKKLEKEYYQCISNIDYNSDSSKYNQTSICFKKYSSEKINKMAISWAIILFIFLIVIFFPTKKRLNDLDMSWWHYLWFIVPLFLIIFLRVFIYKINGYHPIIDSLNFLWLIIPIFLLFLIFKKWKNNLEKNKENPNNLENNLQKIKELFEKGLISEEEYEAKKKKILDL